MYTTHTCTNTALHALCSLYCWKGCKTTSYYWSPPCMRLHGKMFLVRKMSCGEVRRSISEGFYNISRRFMKQQTPYSVTYSLLCYKVAKIQFIPYQADMWITLCVSADKHKLLATKLKATIYELFLEIRWIKNYMKFDLHLVAVWWQHVATEGLQIHCIVNRILKIFIEW